MKIENHSDGFERGKSGDDEETEADFETAIAATNFGKFNYILILIAIPSGWSAMFDSASMSYVLPAAHCDLNLNLEERGMLNGITYLGMISSAFIWGALADAFGRKKLLIVGFGLDAFFVILAGFSQSFQMLLAAKFMTGFIINGPFAALTAALSEFHSKKRRTKILIRIGIVYSFANLVLPLVAWGVLPQYWEVTSEHFVLHSWNFFIIISALPSLLSAIGNSFLPESPKFLMSSGKNEEAMGVFRRIYAVNTGKSPESYPIKSLVDEVKQNTEVKKTSKEKIIDGLKQIKTLFLPPHLINIILVCVMFMGFLMGSNTLRLWLPQIFTAINDYQTTHKTTTDLCQMLEVTKPSNDTVSIEDCFVNKSVGGVYTNVIIISCTTILGTLLAGLFVNKVGKKTILVVLGTIAGVCGFCIYFAQNTETTTTLSAIMLAMLGVCINVQLSVVVDLFPTNLRTLAISLALMVGRIGAMGGNVIFPMLLGIGCLPPFLLIGCSVLITIFVIFLIPNTDMKALE